MNQIKLIALILAGTSCGSVSAIAQLFSQKALVDETILVAGPRGNRNFHNAQSEANQERFRSYAITTYQMFPSDFGLVEVEGIESVAIEYTQANATFTNSGAVEFFVTFDQRFGAGDYSALSHGVTGTGILDSQFSDSPTLQKVGSGLFTAVASGTVDRYTLDFSGALATSLINTINNLQVFSIIIATPAGSTASATYGGSSNANPPEIFVTAGAAIPEPDSLPLILSLTFLAGALRRRVR